MQPPPPKAWLFEAQDPRGRVVRCSRERWEAHILSQRPWMAGWEEDVIAAIRRPHIGIYRDRDSADRQIYYRRQDRKGRARYLKVIVEFRGNGDEGVVISAFPVDSPKPGEKLIWPTSND